jgi:hypothetical protein
LRRNTGISTKAELSAVRVNVTPYARPRKDFRRPAGTGKRQMTARVD